MKTEEKKTLFWKEQCTLTETFLGKPVSGSEEALEELLAEAVLRSAEAVCLLSSDLKDLFIRSRYTPLCLLRVIKRQINKDSGYVMPM